MADPETNYKEKIQINIPEIVLISVYLRTHLGVPTIQNDVWGNPISRLPDSIKDFEIIYNREFEKYRLNRSKIDIDGFISDLIDAMAPISASLESYIQDQKRIIGYKDYYKDYDDLLAVLKKYIKWLRSKKRDRSKHALSNYKIANIAMYIFPLCDMFKLFDLNNDAHLFLDALRYANYNELKVRNVNKCKYLTHALYSRGIMDKSWINDVCNNMNWNNITQHLKKIENETGKRTGGRVFHIAVKRALDKIEGLID